MKLTRWRIFPPTLLRDRSYKFKITSSGIMFKLHSLSISIKIVKKVGN